MATASPDPSFQTQTAKSSSPSLIDGTVLPSTVTIPNNYATLIGLGAGFALFVTMIIISLVLLQIRRQRRSPGEFITSKDIVIPDEHNSLDVTNTEKITHETTIDTSGYINSEWSQGLLNQIFALADIRTNEILAERAQLSALRSQLPKSRTRPIPLTIKSCMSTRENRNINLILDNRQTIGSYADHVDL